jgi:uncharacterized protein (TIGR03435 family)
MTHRIEAAILWAALGIGLGCAQPATLPQFEVASVKASPPVDRPVYTMRGGPGTNSPGQITYINVKVRMLVATAWDLKDYQLSGPDSMDNVRFDIIATVAPDTSKKDFQLMLQRLLAERVGLVVHHELKETPVYEMVIAKGGLKMKDAEPAREGGTPPPTGRFETDRDGFIILPPGRAGAATSGLGGVTRRSARMQSVAGVVAMMEQYSGRPVTDKSGLTGQYDYKLAFDTASAARPRQAGVPASVAAARGPLPGTDVPREPMASDPAPTFLEAVAKQLGLKLEPAKAAIDVVFVDRFNKEPTEN